MVEAVQSGGIGEKAQVNSYMACMKHGMAWHGTAISWHHTCRHML